MLQKTLIVIKPDGVRRKLAGRILSTFEDADICITQMRLLTASRTLIENHYPPDSKWLLTVGNKTLESYQETGLDPKEEVGFSDPREIGMMIRDWLVSYVTMGPVIAAVLEGNLVVSSVRKLCGHTLPNKAEPGSIRGRFGVDSPEVAHREKRAVYNLIHSSGTPEEAEREITLWFGSL